MNKRIYFQDKFIEFTGEQGQNEQNQAFKNLSFPLTEKNHLKILSNFLDPSTKDCIILPISEFELFFERIKQQLYYIEAAGGFIEKQGQFLGIFRLGRWDLPKGKLEKNESIEQGAIRECEEECAISELQIKQQLQSTFHIYPYKDYFAIKQSYWFYMTTTYDKPLRPQIEENIEEVRWFNKEELQTVILKNTYFTIEDVLNEGIQLMSAG